MFELFANDTVPVTDDAHEYSIYILVTFPDGKRIITQSAELANAMQANGAETVHITELGE